jgi:hypothetical protein
MVDDLEGGSGKASRLVTASGLPAVIRFKRYSSAILSEIAYFPDDHGAKVALMVSGTVKRLHNPSSADH